MSITHLAVDPLHLGQGHLGDGDGVQAEDDLLFPNLRRQNFAARRYLDGDHENKVKSTFFKKKHSYKKLFFIPFGQTFHLLNFPGSKITASCFFLGAKFGDSCQTRIG